MVHLKFSTVLPSCTNLKYCASTSDLRMTLLPTIPTILSTTADCPNTIAGKIIRKNLRIDFVMLNFIVLVVGNTFFGIRVPECGSEIIYSRLYESSVGQVKSQIRNLK